MDPWVACLLLLPHLWMICQPQMGPKASQQSTARTHQHRAQMAEVIWHDQVVTEAPQQLTAQTHQHGFQMAKVMWHQQEGAKDSEEVGASRRS